MNDSNKVVVVLQALAVGSLARNLLAGSCYNLSPRYRDYCVDTIRRSENLLKRCREGRIHILQADHLQELLTKEITKLHQIKQHSLQTARVHCSSYTRRTTARR